MHDFYFYLVFLFDSFISSPYSGDMRWFSDFGSFRLNTENNVPGKKDVRVLENPWFNKSEGFSDSTPDSGLIFNLFERGNATEVSNKVAGTGIGLAICKAIVEAHQGNIQAKNHLVKDENRPHRQIFEIF